jgi:tRNA pseudouridine38/39 synthase
MEYSYKQKIAKIRANNRAEREFDPSKHSTRLIALKLAYLGKYYNGFEYHANNPTPLPTIEEELWKALNKSRLIMPKDNNPLQPEEVNWEGCEYSKCGRTDKGVSAFGQVIGIRVRSNRPLEKWEASDPVDVNGAVASTSSQTVDPVGDGLKLASPALLSSDEIGGEISGEINGLGENYLEIEDALPFDPIKDEIPYPVILNRLLPPDIRILAWCPAPPPDFSARFSCKERQYKYFFTQPAFPPMPQHLVTKSKGATAAAVEDGWLDIATMQEAAKNFIGLHDFRNFCKVDASKQITNFERRIFHADIVEEDATLGFVNGASFLPENSRKTDGSSQSSRYPKVYSFTLHGSAFLWHQVRHMIAVLFLVGQGLESPSIISELLDVKKNPRRPIYEMATDVPLVLWDCIFPHEDDIERKDTLQWLYVGDEPGRGAVKYGTQGLMEDVWRLWRERKIDEVLAGTLIDVVASQGKDVQSLTSTPKRGTKSQRVFDGRNAARLQGTYIPVMKKPLLESTETINEKYAIRKGWESAQDLKEQGFRRLKKSMSPADDVDE